MKKLIVILSIFMLTGCFENSGYITKSCAKEDITVALNSKTTYTFKFKNDIISELNVTYDYNSIDENTLLSIKTSYEGQNRFLDLNYNENEGKDSYTITYSLPLDANEMIKDKFIIKKTRTELVNKLKESGYICE